MAEHWAQGMYVVAWRDARANGRMRMSWDESLDRLRKTVLNLESCTDAVIYGPLTGGERMRALAAAPPEPKKKPKPKKKARPAAAVAAAA